MAKITSPPPSHEFRPQYYVLQAGTAIKRIYDPTTKYKVTASSFRYFGPRARFDHQQRIKGKAAINPDRGVIYAGFSLTCCLVEIFAEDGTIEIGQHELATIMVAKDLKLLDITTDHVWNAGASVASVMQGKRGLTQAWGCHFYDDEATYGKVDGLIYTSANNGEKAIALYERAESTITTSEIYIQRMQERSFRKELVQTADSLGLPVKFI